MMVKNLDGLGRVFNGFRGAEAGDATRMTSPVSRFEAMIAVQPKADELDTLCVDI